MSEAISGTIVDEAFPPAASLRRATRRDNGHQGDDHWTSPTGPNQRTPSPFRAIRAVDYTVVFVRDMTSMRRFYENILAFPLLRELSPNWIEYRMAPTRWLLHGRAAPPPMNQPFGRRTLFFRDPDGNLLEVFAET